MRRKWNPASGHWEEVEEEDKVPVEQDEFCEKCKEDVLPDQYDCCPKCGGWIDTYEKGDVWNRGSGSTWGGSSYKPWWQKSTAVTAPSAYGSTPSVYKPQTSLSGSWSSWGYGGYGGYGAAGGIGTIGSSLGWSSSRTNAYEMMKYKNQLDSLCTIVDPLVKHHLIWNGMEDTNYSILEKSLICLDGTRLLEDGEKHLDVASGLAIHEKLHLIHTKPLNDWQKNIKETIIMQHGHWGWKLFLSVCNVLEDEYIEKQLKKTCPGYIAYIQATKDFYWKKYEDELTNPEESDFGDLFNSFLLQVRYPSVLSKRQKGRWGKHLNAISGILKDKLHKDTRLGMMQEVFNYFMGLAIVMEEEQEDCDGKSGKGGDGSITVAIEGAEGAGIELTDEDKENIAIALRLTSGETRNKGLKPGEEIIKEMGELWDIIKTLLEGEKQKKIEADLAKQIKEMEDEDYAETKLSPSDAFNARQKKIIWRSVQPDKKQSDLYKDERQEMLPEINKLRRKISLYGNPLPLTIRNQKRGRLDKRVLHRIPMDRTDLFNIKIIKQDNPVDICLLVDESGSMGWGKIESARRAAIAMKEALQDNPKVQLWVFGHSADESGGGNTEMFEYSGPKMADRPLACGAMRARYENRDGNAILASAHRVKEQSMTPHTQKLMIVFSDGQPSAQGYRGFSALAHTKKCVSKVENEGWDVIQVGFGVRKETMARMFKNYVQIEDMKYLANTLTKIIRRVLKI